MKDEKWIDYQDVFTKRFELSRQLSLEEALERTENEPECLCSTLGEIFAGLNLNFVQN